MTRHATLDRTARRASAIALCCALALGGCGTLSTLDAMNDGAPLVFGGTRLNLAALENPAQAHRRHRVAPPRLPALDLPLSATLVVIMLPYTVGSALSRALMSGGRQ